MPLLANFIGTIAEFFVGILGRFMGFSLALKYASFLAWSAVIAGYVAATLVCLIAMKGIFTGAVSALGPATSTNWVGYLAVGLGMVIPTNAPAILACMASVWIATQIAKIQKQGIENFSK